MTENEQKIIKKISDLSGDYKCYNNRINHEESLVLDRLLTEIQQYRVIGTVEEIKTAIKYVQIAKMHGTVGKAIDACAEYEAIGTIEEFKALKEKNEPKKPITYSDTNRAECPICETTVRGISRPFGDYCARCGQALDWSE